MINSTRSLVIFIVFVVIFITALQPITDPDFWWHLKTGQYIIQTHGIPHTDIFSSSRLGSEWITHEWLSEVFMYAVYRIAGFAGLIVTFALLITISFWVVYIRFRSRVGYPVISALALILGAAATTLVWGTRPQIFTLLFASIFLYILDNYYAKKSEKAIWWLVPLMVLWVNLHAGWALGLALIALTLLGPVLDVLLGTESRDTLRERVPALFGVFVACSAAVCINPNGTRMYSYPLETLTSKAMMQFIEEWKSPDFHQPHFQAVLILLLGTFFLLAVSNKRERPGRLLMLLATSFAMLRSGRNIPFFSLVATPLFAEHLWEWLQAQPWANRLIASSQMGPPKRSIPQIVINSLIVVVVLSFCGLAARRAAAKQPVIEEQEFPKAAVDYIKLHGAPQPIFNEYAWGGYLIWRLYPDYRIHIDGRADVFGDKLVEEFIQVNDGKPRWRELLQQYGTQTVLVKRDSAIVNLLSEDSRWQKVFEDKQAVILVLKEQLHSQQTNE
jgi:hypothetical protein